MKQLNLDTIVATLEGLEETIIFKLIDRAQFKVNHSVYEPGKSGFVDADNSASLFELRLRYHEEADALFGRFCAPEERPFCKDLPIKKRAVTLPETGLVIDDYDTINLTEDIKKMYIQSIPKLCIAGDDQQYGSSVEHDVYALQAIARRIHFGALYVAECKYQKNPEVYRKIIDQHDEQALLETLTRKDVEQKIIERVKNKVAHVQSGINPQVRRSIDPEIILRLYEEHIIPLTKKGEIVYLLQRKPQVTP